MAFQAMYDLYKNISGPRSTATPNIHLSYLRNFEGELFFKSPLVLVADREQALTNALGENVVGRAKRYFSIGHAQFNTAVSTGLSIEDVERERFKLAEQFNTFMRIWWSVVTAPTTLHKQPKKLVDHCEKTRLIPHKRQI
ncbi:hypothetical protein ACJ73_05987, partial [Blastomyces percursus]